MTVGTGNGIFTSSAGQDPTGSFKSNAGCYFGGGNCGSETYISGRFEGQKRSTLCTGRSAATDRA